MDFSEFSTRYKILITLYQSYFRLEPLNLFLDSIRTTTIIDLELPEILHIKHNGFEIIPLHIDRLKKMFNNFEVMNGDNIFLDANHIGVVRKIYKNIHIDTSFNSTIIEEMNTLKKYFNDYNFFIDTEKSLTIYISLKSTKDFFTISYDYEKIYEKLEKYLESMSNINPHKSKNTKNFYNFVKNSKHIQLGYFYPYTEYLNLDPVIFYSAKNCVSFDFSEKFKNFLRTLNAFFKIIKKNERRFNGENSSRIL